MVLLLSSFGLAGEAGILLSHRCVGTECCGKMASADISLQKEKSFYARIKRYRADPSSSSPQNPIPDYYGEKVASVKDYRRWLKDQRAFNRKKNRAFVI